MIIMCSYKGICQLVIIALLSVVIHNALSDTVYIVTSSSSSCPGETSGTPCPTLDQYAQEERQSQNITMLLEPGLHTLSRHLTVSTSYSFTMSSSSTSGNTRILLHYSHAAIVINSVTNVNISGIKFQKGIINCVLQIRNVMLVLISNAIFEKCGGAVWMTEVRMAVLTNNSFRLNSWTSVLKLTSASVTIHANNFSRNKVEAIHLSSSRVTIEKSMFNFNNVSKGVIHIYNSESSYPTVVRIDRSTFRYNIAENSGGAIHAHTKNSESLTIVISRSVFTHNTAKVDGGAIYICSYLSTCVTVEIKNASVFSYNTAGVRHYPHDPSHYGGAICAYHYTDYEASSYMIDMSTFSHNSVYNGNGGALYIYGSRINVNRSYFINNTASLNGGVLNFYSKGFQSSNYDISIQRSQFSNNTAGDNGGVLYIAHLNSFVVVVESVFDSNSAVNKGGAIALVNSSVHIKINRTNAFNNTAQFGRTMAVCNSEIVFLEKSLMVTSNPVLQYCKLYEEDIKSNATSTPESTSTSKPAIMPTTTYAKPETESESTVKETVITVTAELKITTPNLTTGSLSTTKSMNVPLNLKTVSVTDFVATALTVSNNTENAITTESSYTPAAATTIIIATVTIVAIIVVSIFVLVACLCYRSCKKRNTNAPTARNIPSRRGVTYAMNEIRRFGKENDTEASQGLLARSSSTGSLSPRVSSPVGTHSDIHLNGVLSRNRQYGSDTNEENQENIAELMVCPNASPLDYSEVFKLLLPMASEWQNLAVLLGIPNSSSLLQEIRQDNNTVKNCLRAMLTEWLKQTNPRPTWNTLAEAVKSLGNPAMAEEIRAKYGTEK